MSLQCLLACFSSNWLRAGGDVVWGISRWLPWWPFWILEPNDFSYSESPCHPNNSYQLSFREQMWFDDFQDGHHCGHLWYRNATTLTDLNLHVAAMPPTMFQLKLALVLEDMWFEAFQDGHHGVHFWYMNGMILAILNLYFPSMPTIKF